MVEEAIEISFSDFSAVAQADLEVEVRRVFSICGADGTDDFTTCRQFAGQDLGLIKVGIQGLERLIL